MTIRVALTPIIDDAGDEPALTAALAAAAFAGAPEGAMVTADILTLWERDAGERALRARARYERWRDAAGLAEAAAAKAPAEITASWVETSGDRRCRSTRAEARHRRSSRCGRDHPRRTRAR